MNKSPQKPSSKRRFRLLYPLYLIVVLLVAGEVTVRLMGVQAWQPAEQSFSVKPEGPFFRPDSILGYKGRAGRYALTVADELQYSVTHDSSGFRITSPESSGADTLNRPEIWILGCSFTHGFGVNDRDTYPWQLQNLMPGYKIRNLGMDGYGTLQSLLLLREELKLHPAPKLVVLAYGAFHDQRNTSNRFWRKVLYGREVVEGLRYPQIRYDEQDSLKVSYSKLEYRPFPLMRISALSHYLEIGYNNREDERLRSKEISRFLVTEIVETCSSQTVSFLLAGIYRHPDTDKMLQYFAEKGISTLDLSLDLDQKELRILPSDGHPNAKAHKMMAEKLATYLNEELQTDK